MQVRNVTVVGAGNMGAGIAQAFATAGFAVRLNDVDAAAVARGIERIRGPLAKRVADGKMPQAELDRVLGNLRPEPDLAHALVDTDLVVEAVFEDLKVKTDLFARLDGMAPAKTILATNTSSLYVKDLAAVTKRADKVVGLHFFFPAAINKLVEVVRGPQTSPDTFTSAYAAAKRAGKVPIETADAPGFCVNRFFVPWVNEACRLLDEGVADVPTIEAAAKEAFGITMGPFELMNVTGVPISLHAQTTLHRELGAFYEPARSLRAQVERKANWDPAGTPDPARKEAAAARLRGVVFAIATKLVEEKVATIRDTDRGATIGLRWAKGPFAMMNALGVPKSLSEVKALCKPWAQAFPVPPTLEVQAKSGAPWPLPAVAVEFREADTVALITFDRPEALNALSPSVLEDLGRALDDVEARATVRAVVVTGEGKAFIAGADIPTMRALDAAGAKAYTELGNRVIDRLAALPCPVLVAINGFAFGGGLELALAGDLLYAADNAQLGLPEVGLGIHPGFGGTQRLPRRIGPGAAKEMIFTGRTLKAAEARSIGLVDAVVPAADLLDHCLDVARAIAQKAPLAVAGAKSAIDRGLHADLRTGLALEQESVILLFSTKDKQEGLDAFVEKRAPRFVGR
jgi:enoyl-CoA hydratase / 3-hydroxyacyl-CoA dehydrogenase